jgi:hypothetical protein
LISLSLVLVFLRHCSGQRTSPRLLSGIVLLARVALLAILFSQCRLPTIRDLSCIAEFWCKPLSNGDLAPPTPEVSRQSRLSRTEELRWSTCPTYFHKSTTLSSFLLFVGFRSKVYFTVRNAD